MLKMYTLKNYLRNNIYIYTHKWLASFLKIDFDDMHFVDNTLIWKLINHQILYHKANIMLRDILSWFNNNFLEFNLNKIKCISFNIQRK